MLKTKVLHYLHEAFHSIYTQIFILIMIIFVLFSADVEVFVPYSVHLSFIYLRNICFFLFSIEIILALMFEQKYFMSLYFFMDVIDLISLATEASIIWTPVLNFLDNNSKNSSYMSKYILDRSIQNSPGIALDTVTIKYLYLFKVVSYLKVMRIAKVIETTRKINYTVQKNRKQKKKGGVKILRRTNVLGTRQKKLDNNSKLDQKYINDLIEYNQDLNIKDKKLASSKSNRITVKRSTKKNKSFIPLLKHRVSITQPMDLFKMKPERKKIELNSTKKLKKEFDIINSSIAQKNISKIKQSDTKFIKSRRPSINNKNIFKRNFTIKSNLKRNSNASDSILLAENELDKKLVNEDNKQSKKSILFIEPFKENERNRQLNKSNKSNKSINSILTDKIFNFNNEINQIIEEEENHSYYKRKSIIFTTKDQFITEEVKEEQENDNSFDDYSIFPKKIVSFKSNSKKSNIKYYNSKTLSHWEQNLTNYKYSNQKIKYQDNFQNQDLLKSNDLFLTNNILGSKNQSSKNSRSDSLSKVSSEDIKSNDLDSINKKSEDVFDQVKATDNAASNILNFNNQNPIEEANSKSESNGSSKSSTIQDVTKIEKDNNKLKDKEDNNSDNSLNINYNNVSGLNDIEDDDSQQFINPKKEKLLLETILFQLITLKMIMLIMLIIIFLQLTQNNYFEQILNITTNNKITYCMNLFNHNVNNAIQYDYDYYQIKDNQDYLTFPVNKDNKFIYLLNYTISNCFKYLIEVPQHYLKDDIAKKEYSLYNFTFPIVEDDYDDYDFLLVNLTSCKEYKLLQQKYFINISFPLETASEKYFKTSHLFTNLDYIYQNIVFNSEFKKESYLEYMVYIKSESNIDKVMNIVRSIYVTVILLSISYNFRRNLHKKVIKPTIKIIKKFRDFFHLESLSYYNILIEDDKGEEDTFLYKKLGLFSYLFDLTIGKKILGLITQSNHLETINTKYEFNTIGIKTGGTCVVLNICYNNESLLSNKLSKINRLYSIFHSMAYGYLGEVVTENMMFWNENDIQFQMFHNEYCKRISK